MTEQTAKLLLSEGEKKFCYLKPMITGRWNFYGIVPAPLVKRNQRGWRSQARALVAASKLSDEDCAGITFYLALTYHPQTL